MALPIRTQIRNAVTALLTGLPTTGNRVFASRIHALAPTDLPALLVYARSEQVEADTFGAQAEQTRTLDLEIKALMASASSLDDTADLIDQEIEAALVTDQTLGGMVSTLTVHGVVITADAQAETPVGEMTMRCEIIYHTTEGAI